MAAAEFCQAGFPFNRSKIVEEALRVWQTLHQAGDVDKVLEEALRLFRKEQELKVYRSYYAALSNEVKFEAA
jgi:hypothetical protein